MKRIVQFASLLCLLSFATIARSDSDCMSSDLSTRAAAADWSVPVAACMTSDTPIKPMAAARPMLVTREKMMASGDAPFRSPSRRHPAGGDPVLGDGEFYEQRVDATLAGVGPHYEFKRTYRSRVSFDGALGPSWDHNYDMRILGIHGSGNGREYISPACDNSFDFQDGELNVVHFTRDDAASWNHPLYRAKGTGLTLDLFPSTNGDIAWQIHGANGGTLIFDTAGYLSKIVDVAGNSLTFDWELSNVYMPDAVVYGPAKHLVRVHDGARTVNYLYDAQKALQCISLGTSCGDATTRPAEVLAYFVYTPNHELQTVYHGQGTSGERMVYRSSGSLILLSYYPPDCIPNESLAPFCNRFCGTVDANNPASCANVDASSSYLNYCSHVTCQLAPGASSATTPDQILCKRAAITDGPDPLCMSVYDMSPGCLQGCLSNRQCIMSWGVPRQAFWAFGSDDDLPHNITDIYDERGKLEVHNEYGETPWDISFDRVTSQKLGGPSDDNTTVKFAYHDLVIEQAGGVSILPPSGVQIYPGPYSTPDPANVVPRPQYGEGSVCPRASSCANAPDGTCSIATYNAAASFAVFPTAPPIPASATVITDVHGITHTQYFDADMNLIREVNDLAHETTDYNYDVNGYLIGVQDPSGVRQCFERDLNGHATQATTLPASGFGGVQTPMATAYRFDAGQQLTDIWTDVFGIVGKTHLGRDAHERVAYEDRDVKVGQPPMRTSYTYDEDPSPVGIREMPATETLPDGRVNQYLHIDPSLGGPQDITLDVHGSPSKTIKVQYDDRGRVVQKGEPGRFATHWGFDPSNRLQLVGHRDNDAAAWIDDTYGYSDSPGDGPTVITEARRKTVYGYLGRYVNTITRAGVGGASQTRCEHYSADGRLEAELLPEGNEQLYSYDVAGRLKAVWKGYNSTTPTQQWVQGCSVKQRLNGDPGMALITARAYRAGGFLSQQTDHDVTRYITTDGFGRPIRSDGPDALPIAARQTGYDTRGRVVWSAEIGKQIPYGKPTMTTTALVSMTEYDYDLADRVVAERRWLVGTGEIMTTTYDYDDAHRTTTVTDRGAVTSTTVDGFGRIVSRKAADGSTMSMWHYVGYDVVKTQTNQGKLLTRTIQMDTRDRVTGVLDENGAPLSGTGYDDDGHITTESHRGVGTVIRTYDDFGRLVRVHKDLLNGGVVETQLGWDDDDRPKTYTDGAGQKWTKTYTGFDAPLTTTDPLGRTDSNSYLVGFSHRIGNVDAVGRHQCFRYDYDMRLSYLYDVDCPGGQEVPYGPLTPMRERRWLQYTAVGQLYLAIVSPDDAHPGSSIMYSYDSLGRPTDESVGINTPPIGPYSVHHDYPNLGRTVVTTLSGQGYSPPVPPIAPCTLDVCPPPPPPPPPPPTFFASFRESSDAMGRLGSVDLNGARMATWSWGTGIGGPLTLAYADNTTTTYSYDGLLRQTNMVVTQPQSGIAAAAARVSASPSFSKIIGGGGGSGGGGGGCPPGVWCPPPTTTNVVLASMQDAYGLDSVVRMRQRVIGYGAPITDVYQIDGDARLTAESLALPNVTMPAGEVGDSTVSQYLGQGQHWRYLDVDGNGNWLSTVAPPSGASVLQNNDAVGQLHAIGSTTMNADARGNLTGLAGDAIGFTYDDFSGLMISASNGGATTTYSYDAADRRAIEISATSQSVLLWDGARIIAHGDPAALVIDVPGADVDQHVASVDNGGLGAARFYHQGPDQSMLAITDASGLIEGYSYSAFGEATVWSAFGTTLPASRVGNRFGFQGQWLDPATGSYAMRARQYVPRWGRFTSRDPIGLGGGASLYAFTGSRPIAMRDPSGLLPVGQNGFHGPKSCAYCGGWGVWGMGDGDWGGFNATGGIGDYPFLPSPDEWNPDTGADPSADGRGAPTGDAVKDGTGLMAGPGAPNIPKGVSCDGDVCKGADGSIVGSLADGQFLPVQTYRVSEVAPVAVSFILPVSPWLLPETWRVFPDPFAPNRTIAVAPNGFTMAYDKPGKNQGGRGGHWHIHSPPYNPKAHFKPGTDISDPFSGLSDVDASLVIGVYYGPSAAAAAGVPDPLSGAVPMVPVTMSNAAGFGSVSSAAAAARPVDPAPFFEFFGAGEFAFP